MRPDLKQADQIGTCADRRSELVVASIAGQIRQQGMVLIPRQNPDPVRVWFAAGFAASVLIQPTGMLVGPKMLAECSILANSLS